ncbi:MAG: COG3014 family protein [Planctomycetota bacterium]|jgi:hypothetical protein
MRSPCLLTLIAGCLLALSACRAHSEKVAEFRAYYHEGDFGAADAAVDKVIAKESGAEVEEVDRTEATQVRSGKGDTYLLLLEKGMTQLALGQPKTATQLFRTARDEMDAHCARNVKQYFASVMSDDRALDYQGADYEHIMVRVMLCLCDLLVSSSQTGGDAYAYALQVGEKQEEILKSPLGDDVGYKPRQNYRRVGIGAYLQGMILEATGAMDGAERAYARCVDYEPRFQLGKLALERARTGHYARQGEGVLHVFYLGGPGPFYAEGVSPPTEAAMRIAQLVVAILADSAVPLMQTKVPVPVHVFLVRGVPRLRVATGPFVAQTETILDVNQVSAQQLEAMMPMILARAVIRRSVKTAVTTAGSKAVRNKKGKGSSSAGWAELGFAMANLLWTGSERADTRIWTALPAQIQVARMQLPAGSHVLQFGPDLQETVQIGAGRDTYAVVVRPNLRRPGALLVDQFSLAPPGLTDTVP